MFTYKSPTYRADAAPTETQMKLAIAQTLSQSFAYNAPVIVLDFEVDEEGGMTGRFKDAARPRVFSFEIDGESVSYKPFKPGRMDSEDDVVEWEEFSKGYAYRVDAGISSGKKPQCQKPTSYNCGAACININKGCKSSPNDAIGKERLNKLKDASLAFAKANDGDKFADANKKIVDIQSQRSAKAKSILKEKSSKKKAISSEKDKTNQENNLTEKTKPTLPPLPPKPGAKKQSSIDLKGLSDQDKKEINNIAKEIIKKLGSNPTKEQLQKAKETLANEVKKKKEANLKAQSSTLSKAKEQTPVKQSETQNSSGLIGDGTHKNAPKNAKEYFDAMKKTGKKITMEEAIDTIDSIRDWETDRKSVV